MTTGLSWVWRGSWRKFIHSAPTNTNWHHNCPQGNVAFVSH
jgi:hypothetical protein